jgi:hypothetical protein
VAAAGLSAAVAFATFVALNPTVTAQFRRPQRAMVLDAYGFPITPRQSVWARTRAVMKFRMGVSRRQQEHPDFQVNALHTWKDKVEAVAVQGYGRYALLGPPRASSMDRINWRLDWGCFVWGPVVALGAVVAFLKGRAQWRAAEPSTAWAVLLQAVVTLVVVTAYIPLAWDRYFLPLQSGSSLLAAGLALAVVDRLLARPRPDRGRGT